MGFGYNPTYNWYLEDVFRKIFFSWRICGVIDGRGLQDVNSGVVFSPWGIWPIVFKDANNKSE